MNPQNCLQLPLVLHVVRKSNSCNERIYIYDNEMKIVFVFDSNFKLKSKIGYKMKITNHMNVDVEYESNILYASHMLHNEITLWNTENGSLIVKINVDGPKDIAFNRDNLFVVNQPDVKTDWVTNKVIKISKGNSVSIIDKKSLELKHRIQFNNLCIPNTLHFTKEMNIYTIAYELDANGFMSKYRYLYIIDYNGNILKSFELKNISCFNDAVYLDNKIIVSGNLFIQNRISIIEFE